MLCDRDWGDGQSVEGGDGEGEAREGLLELRLIAQCPGMEMKSCGERAFSVAGTAGDKGSEAVSELLACLSSMEEACVTGGRLVVTEAVRLGWSLGEPGGPGCRCDYWATPMMGV